MVIFVSFDLKRLSIFNRIVRIIISIIDICLKILIFFFSHFVQVENNSSDKIEIIVNKVSDFYSEKWLRSLLNGWIMFVVYLLYASWEKDNKTACNCGYYCMLSEGEREKLRSCFSSSSLLSLHFPSLHSFFGTNPPSHFLLHIFLSFSHTVNQLLHIYLWLCKTINWLTPLCYVLHSSRSFVFPFFLYLSSVHIPSPRYEHMRQTSLWN